MYLRMRVGLSCHLVAVRETTTRLCDRTDLPKVYIRFVYSLIRESINECVIRRYICATPYGSKKPSVVDTDVSRDWESCCLRQSDTAVSQHTRVYRHTGCCNINITSR